MGTIYKKIFHSLDLRWNRLINARTDMGDEKYQTDETIANKGYLTKMSTYDTDTAKKYGCDTESYPDNFPTRSPFSWMQNFITYKKTWKEIFDQLIHPKLNPVYLNPELKSFKIDILSFKSDIQNFSPQFNDNSKLLIFENVLYNCRVYIDFTDTKRLMNDLQPKELELTFLDNLGGSFSNQKFKLYNYNGDNLKYYCDIYDCPLANIATANIHTIWNAIDESLAETNTHFEIYKPSEFFTKIYESNIDVKDILLENFECNLPVLWRKNNGTQSSFSDNYQSYDELRLNNVLISESVVAENGDNDINSWDLLVPEDLWKKYFLKFSLYTASLNSEYGIFDEICIPQKTLLNGFSFDVPKIITINNIKYVLLNANFGNFYNFPSNFRIRLTLKNKLSSI